METPKSPIKSESPPPDKPSLQSKDVVMGGTESAPAYTPFQHHPQDELPEAIKKAYPSGNPTDESRTPEQQAAFNAQKDEIMRTMTQEEQLERYKQVASQIVHHLEENEKKLGEWKQEKEKLDTEQALEEKVLKQMLNTKDED